MKTLQKWAFTILELLITIWILAILGTVSIIYTMGFLKDSRDASRLTNISTIQSALAIYTIDVWAYPEPENSLSYSWWIWIKQWTIWKNVASRLRLVWLPVDPLTNAEYIYSTSWNLAYYQIGAELENWNVSSLVPNTFAADTRTPLVKGKYDFDPSLPSLIVVPSSVTWSGIFDPNVCFVLNWWKNNFNTCVEKKSEMALKDFDKSLVGYWDMETLSWALLKDLSGNWNEGTFSWGMDYNNSLTWAINGKGLNFNWNYIIETIKNIELKDSPSISVSILLNSKDSSEMLWYTNSAQVILESSDNFNYNTGSFVMSDFDKSNMNFKVYSTNFGVKYKVYPSEYHITRTWEKSTEWFKLITLVASYWENNEKEVFWYINWKKITYNTDNSYLYKVINKYYEDRFLDYSVYFWNRKNYRWYSKNLGFLWIIDDVKIYNRALSDQEILQQAKIAGF